MAYVAFCQKLRLCILSSIAVLLRFGASDPLQKIVPFESLTEQHWLPSSSAFSEWHSATSISHPDSLATVFSEVSADLLRSQHRTAWRMHSDAYTGQPIRPALHEEISLVIALNYETDRRRAIHLLFFLLSDPRNAVPKSSQKLSLAQYHQRAMSLGVLGNDKAAEDLRVMSSFPKLFPRYYGEHLSKADSDFLLSPNADKVNAVEHWLASAEVKTNSQCKTVSNARDYYACTVTVQQYIRLIPFADLRIFHDSMYDQRIIRSFPSQPHLLLHHTEAYNPAAAALRTSNAILFIGGATRWPVLHGKPKSPIADRQSDSLLDNWHSAVPFIQKDKQPQQLQSKFLDTERQFNEEQRQQQRQQSPSASVSASASASASSMTVSAVSSNDDQLMVMETGDKFLYVELTIQCPTSSDVLSAVLEPIPRVICLHNGLNYSFTTATTQVSYSFFNSSSSSTSTITHSTNFNASWTSSTSGTSLIPVYTQFRLNLPYNYVNYSLEIILTFQNSDTANTISRTFISTRPITPVQHLNINMVKSWYRWSQTLINNEISSSYWSQAIGSFYLNSASAGYFSPTDLALFLSENQILNGTESAALVQYIPQSANPNDMNDPNNPDLETEVDTQWMAGIAPGIPTDVFHADYSEHPGLEDLLQTIYSLDDVSLPSVLSLSYGGGEKYNAQNNSDEFEAANTLLQQLANRGISVIIAAGDNGAYTNYREYNVGNGANLFQCSDGFEASYPASSPYVTSIGATQLSSINGLTINRDGSASYAPSEVVCSISRGSVISSGGGFSSYFPMPAYQQSVVSTYLSTCGHQPSSNLFNSSNRAYPDISLFGRAYRVVENGRSISVDGTSASTPTFAAFISNVNQQRKLLGMNPLGFLNPILYQLYSSNPEAFEDILYGDNSCAGFDLSSGTTTCCSNGYSACTGFDPVSGLGSPKWDILGPLLVPGISPNIFYYSGAYAQFDGCTSSSSCFPASPTPTPIRPNGKSGGSSNTDIIEVVVPIVVGGTLAILAFLWCCFYGKHKTNETRHQGQQIQLP